ncbi:phage tail tape measure protein [Methylobacterium sp. J-048]|uniref:phage tail tape measure protein n=1 Tax=Methylobacterium sp. J-048 TaxID=2836635 RepID=UPI001FBA32B9|nr:phage tail tape measure protein [Methylobacterium sp. J-048]MCJ2057741.1 phage tail tape measure protein [Methylobacterium sp. J-048]
MTDRMNLEVGVDVNVTDLEQAKALRREFELLGAEILKIGREIKAFANPFTAIGRAKGQLSADDIDSGRTGVDLERQRFADLKRRFAFERRMSSQKRSEESAASAAVREEQRETERALKEQLAFSARIARQRSQAEAEAERETRREIAATARMRDRYNREAQAEAKALTRAQHQAAAGVARGAGQVRAGAGHAVTMGGAAAGVVGYGAKRGIDSLTRSGISIDSAINKNIRLGGINPKDADQDGASLRQRVMPIARSLGVKTSEYLAARAEAIQAGVENELVDVVTEFGSKYARLNDMAPSEVMESSGYGITALSAFGKVTADKVKELFNIQQHLAATTAASRQGLNAFVRRGLSAGAAAGFSVEDILAYGGAATSSGAEGESAARALSSTTERLASLPTRAVDIRRKKHKTQKDQNFLSLPKKLGFRSWAEIKAAFSANAADTMERLYEGLAQVHDPRERLELSEEVWGKEFGSMHAAMAVGHRFRDMRKSVRSKDAGKAIDSGMAVRSGSFDFIVDQITATVTDLKDGLGLVLKPFWADLRDYALKTPTAFKSFDDAFKMGLRGLMQGLGSRDGTMAGLLRQMFGDPGSFKLNAIGIGEFMRGFGQGLRDVGNAVVSFVKMFAGQNASPAELGRWTSRILGFSAALLVAAPAVTVLAGLTTAVAGFATVMLSTWKLMQAAGIVGAAAGAPKLPTAPGAVAAEGWLARFGRLLGIGAFTPTAGLSKPDQDKLTGRLGAYALKLEKHKQATTGGWVDPPTKAKPAEQSAADKVAAEQKRQTEILQEQLRLQQEALQLDKAKQLGDAAKKTAGGAITDSIHDTARSAAASVMSGAVGNGGGGSSGGPLGDTGMRRNGIIGGGGSASSNPANSAASAQMLDAIAGTESGRAGYDAVLGNGKYGTPSKPVSAMSLDEAFAFGRQVKARHGTSSALGRYQIVGRTMRAAQKAMNIPGNAIFDQAMQDRMARWIARNQGLGAWEGLKHNPGAMARARGAMAQGGAQDAPAGGSTVDGVVGSGVGGTSGQVLAQMQQLRRSGQVVNEQCVSLAKAAVGASGSVLDWRKGEGAEAGNLKPGTPVATFLNRNGSQSSRYAGGGTGTMGAGTDHAGVFQSYIRDEAGKIIGMNVAEQYKGSRGVHSKPYMFGQGFGEKNGSNYHAILGSDGQPLGGARNPMARARAAAQAASAPPPGLGQGGAGVGAGGKPQGLGEIDVTPTRGGGGLGQNVPIRQSAGASGGGGAGQGGGGHTVTVTNHINGAQDPKAVADEVQRHVQDAMNRRGHDFNPAWT